MYRLDPKRRTALCGACGQIWQTAVMSDYRTQLQHMRDELLARAATTDAQAAVVELDQSKVGRLSRMDAMQAQAMAQAAVARRKQQLQRIEAALKRIEDGEFGLCVVCEEPINPQRLAFNPAVLTCIDCAEKSEQ
ncbi:MAG: TraR/DksA family transcriptional regulator [Pseudomonadota bacterium]|nr:TraR/DksA family transcriptional regulator [Pseudomonadota bacterium]